MHSMPAWVWGTHDEREVKEEVIISDTGIQEPIKSRLWLGFKFGVAVTALVQFQESGLLSMDSHRLLGLEQAPALNRVQHVSD